MLLVEKEVGQVGWLDLGLRNGVQNVGTCVQEVLDRDRLRLWLLLKEERQRIGLVHRNEKTVRQNSCNWTFGVGG